LYSTLMKREREREQERERERTRGREGEQREGGREREREQEGGREGGIISGIFQQASNKQANEKRPFCMNLFLLVLLLLERHEGDVICTIGKEGKGEEGRRSVRCGRDVGKGG